MVYSDSDLYRFLFKMFSKESFTFVLTGFFFKQYQAIFIQMNVIIKVSYLQPLGTLPALNI
jgi:hypothetical protein